MRNQIFRGDAAAVLKTWPEGSVDLVVTSPPYDNLRTYGAATGPAWDFEAIATELTRVLRPGGVICWNVNDQTVAGSETLTSCKQKIFFREKCGLNIHDTMIWEKVAFSHPEKVRYHNLFEYVFILSKGAPTTFHPIRDKKNKWRRAFGKSRYRGVDGQMRDRANPHPVFGEWGMRGNVWKGATAAQENPCRGITHPASMPSWLARDLVTSWSNPGDLVLDPFLGSGTTALAAKALGRDWAGIEINADYAALAGRRLSEAAVAA